MARRVGNRASVLILVLACGTVWAQTVDVVNPSFEDGADGPAGWTLSGREGALTDDAAKGARAITVTGSGKTGDSNYWRSDNLALEPFSVYRLQFKARRVGGEGGCPTTGPVFCNRDVTELSEKWAEYASVFVTPSVINPNEMWLRFGQWEVNGTVAYDDIQLARALPVHRMKDGLMLGEGEVVLGRAYTFQAPMNSLLSNHARVLKRHQCSFNTHRWVFGANSEVVYRQRVGDYKQVAAEAEVTIGYYTSGELLVEASNDGASWKEIGTQDELGSATLSIPGDLLPAAEVWIRLSSRAGEKLGQNADPGSFQVYAYAYRATLDGDAGELRGKTSIVAMTGADPRLNVTIDGFGEAMPGGDNLLVAHVENVSSETIPGQPCLTLTSSNGKTTQATVDVVFAPGVNEVRIPYAIMATGSIQAELRLGEKIAYAAQTLFQISDLYDSSYGEVLPDSNEKVGLWWASSGWKIARTRALPANKGQAIRIQAAKNEVEAAQVVICPAEDMRGFTASCGDLAGPGGAKIPAANIELLRVRYVPVTQPTDKVGVAAQWPDPLPPFQGPIDLEAKKHQPVWVRVKVPRDVPAGVYKGQVHLSAEGYAAEAPLEVTVFDFEFPDRMTCSTAFGFNPNLVFRYHGVTDDTQKRAVLDKYLATLSAHHISPYNPAPLDSFGVTWPNLGKWEGGLRDRSEKHAGESALKIVDDGPNKNASAMYDGLIAIPEKGLKIEFWYKTQDAGHPFIITLLHHDGNGQWMFGKNNDIRIEGNGEWQRFERTVDAFPEGARSFAFKLWPCLYAEDNSTKGTVWYDEIKIADADTGNVLIAGDFEPLDTAALTPSFDWTAWDAAMTKAIDEYHFTSFRLPIIGLGGGTFHARYEPQLLGYGEDTPEYKTAFKAYCEAVEQHLREKGWLDEAFVYWFDEPSPKDYEFVMNGFQKLKKAAPDIRRMLTEQVESEMVGGPNIWCPLTPAFDEKLAQERRADGDRFWWYICTGPKEPYVTLFIDHPGSELRVWGWQTWKRRISGLLIWETTYWTSSAAFPDPAHPQNPYEDPMGWVSGYSTPPGTKRAWGNGDGRFIYPPETAADGHPQQPVLDAPVDSIRFEMLRDGIEDYEYLAMLDALIKKHRDKLSAEDLKRYEDLVNVPEIISKDLTHFTKDPAPIEQHREAVAKALEKLSSM